MTDLPAGTIAVYAAERLITDGPPFPGRDEYDRLLAAERYVAAVQTGDVWAEYRGPRDVFLEIGKSEKWAGTATRERPDRGEVATVRISADEYGPRLLLHELAHVISPPRAGHRKPFVQAYLRLLEERLGEQARDELLVGLVRYGAPGRWELPDGVAEWITDRSVPHALAAAGLRLHFRD